MDGNHVLEVAHRTAWKYKKSSDPRHSDTYTFNDHTLIDFVQKLTKDTEEKISRLEAACEKALEAMQWDVGGEPLPALEVAAIAELKRVLAES